MVTARVSRAGLCPRPVTRPSRTPAAAVALAGRAAAVAARSGRARVAVVTGFFEFRTPDLGNHSTFAAAGGKVRRRGGRQTKPQEATPWAFAATGHGSATWQKGNLYHPRPLPSNGPLSRPRPTSRPTPPSRRRRRWCRPLIDNRAAGAAGTLDSYCTDNSASRSAGSRAVAVAARAVTLGSAVC